MDNLINACASMMIERQLTLAFAESATAGRMAAEFSMAEHAGKFLKGGLVCYDACLKEDLLKVPSGLIEQYTPESAEVTQAIAIGISKLIPSDIAIGITGLTCAGGSETPEKPVGTMFIYGMHDQRTAFKDRLVFDGSPEDIILKTVGHTARLLHQYLIEQKTLISV